MELPIAQSIANNLIEHSSSACDRAQIAGSIRRCKSVVKDIEIVAIVNDYDKLYKRLTSFGRFIKPGVPDIVDWPPKPNAKYVRMLLNEGIKLDLFIATPQNWGGILMLRTGCGVDENGSAFNGFSSGMLQRWKKISAGGKMINGQLVQPDGTVPPQQEEEQIFDLVGLGWIPPEMRTSKKIFKQFVLNK